MLILPISVHVLGARSSNSSNSDTPALMPPWNSAKAKVFLNLDYFSITTSICSVFFEGPVAVNRLQII